MSRRHASDFPDNTQNTPSQQPAVVRAIVSDIVVVTLTSVLIGLGLGDELSDIGQLLVAFLPALGISWAISRAWRDPASIKPSGLSIWVLTVALGLGIVALVAQARPTLLFTVMTTVLLGVFLLGWRLLVRLMER